jgi:hypothetical protein
MRKTGTIKRALAAIVIGIALQSLAGAKPSAAQSKAPLLRKACYFFSNSTDRAESGALREEREYADALKDVYRTWCTAKTTGADGRKKSADALVAKWKMLWDRDNPYNAEFHETGASDLLALMALTHELPEKMVHDAAFTKEWIERCQESCFTIWSVPEDRGKEHYVAMQLWLRNDVLDHLKQGPGSEPVVKMLQEAQFRLVD